MKSLLDPSFRYVPSNETDLRKTFAREWRRLRSTPRNPPPALGNVTTMAPRRKLLT